VVKEIILISVNQCQKIMAKKKTKNPTGTLITNRQANRNYEILETIEAGIELCGTEVKSLRNQKANMADSFARIDNGEIKLYNFHINPYEQGNRFNHDPVRPRRLLLHKREIAHFSVECDRKGSSLIPLRLYLKQGRVKVAIALCIGKRQFDKREDIKKDEHNREMAREISRINRR